MELTNKVPSTPPVVQTSFLVLPGLLPTPSDKFKEMSNLKASIFVEPTLSIDLLSPSVQDDIRFVAESLNFRILT